MPPPQAAINSRSASIWSRATIVQNNPCVLLCCLFVGLFTRVCGNERGIYRQFRLSEQHQSGGMLWFAYI